jgi:hypothetical protein
LRLFQCFEFSDGNLGLMWPDKCGAATNRRQIVKSKVILTLAPDPRNACAAAIGIRSQVEHRRARDFYHEFFLVGVAIQRLWIKLLGGGELMPHDLQQHAVRVATDEAAQDGASGRLLDGKSLAGRASPGHPVCAPGGRFSFLAWAVGFFSEVFHAFCTLSSAAAQ